jgi:sec-independent protein translocase protein TatA
MGPIGVQEMIGIFLIALLLFGPKKLPELGRMMGKGLREFRRMKNEMKTTFETHMQELEREARLAEVSQPKSIASAPDYSSDYSAGHYSYPYEQNVPQAPTYETTAAVEPATGSPVVNHSPTHELPHAPVVPGTVARNGAAPVEEERPA